VIRYVTDACSIGPLLLEDEADRLIASLREALALSECIVPGHWHFEVANMVLMAMRRKRIEPAHGRAGLLRIASLDVPVDEQSTAHALDRTFELANVHALTLYDAAYLELAERLKLPLFTNDIELIEAAAKDGVEVIGK
jgi:predicted nucleic acid-binding protein